MVEGIGAATIALAAAGRPKSHASLRGRSDHPARQAPGPPPDAQDADGQGAGRPDQTPDAAPGLKVNAFAADLQHPRWLYVLPNGDVLAAEALQQEQPVKSALRLCDGDHDAARGRWASAPTASPCLRDPDGDGVAETREVFLDGLNQPFGMALVGDTFYVGNTDGLVAFPFEAGATKLSGSARKLASSSRAAIGRAACWRAGRRDALCRRRLADQHRR